MVCIAILEANDIGVTSFWLNRSQLDSGCIDLDSTGAHREHTDDHDQRQHKAQQSFEFTFHFFHHPFFIINRGNAPGRCPGLGKGRAG